MKFLYILRHNPWGIGGGCYACRNYLELFTNLWAAAEFDVMLCAEYLRPENKTIGIGANVNYIPIPERTKLGRITGTLRGELHRFQRAGIGQLRAKHYDCCIFDHNAICGTLVEHCKRLKIKTIVLNHNCEQEYFRDNHKGLMNMLVLPKVAFSECNSYKKADINIFLTQEDKELFEKIYGDSSSMKIVGGCYLFKDDSYRVRNIQKQGNTATAHPKIVISGTIGNVQNLDGINYFLDELYACVPAECEVIITGKNAPQSLMERIASLPNVKVVPNPENIDAIVSQCDIFLCPTRLGGGMKLRVMDGFRNGLPVIAHRVSARGYTDFEEAGMMWQFDTAEEFGHALRSVTNKIQNDKTWRDKIALKAHSVFDFEQKLSCFTGQIYRLL